MPTTSIPSAAAILADLKKLGRESHRNTYIRHGMTADRIYGVSTADLQKIAKSIKGEQALAMELYDTGIIDAMYLAGLVSNGGRMTKKQLNAWADGAGHSTMISESTVPLVAAESPYGLELAIQWMGSKKEHVASCGWCTYSRMVAALPDDDLDLEEIEKLLEDAARRIDRAPNRVRYTMNGFVIAVGTHVKPLVKQARAAAQKIGAVSVNLGDTACKVPLASQYIAKAESSGKLGEKRKTIR
jgi:3-methyladenine DNA glycosylase AlkD